MIKRIIATILCLVMAVSVFASCTVTKDDDYKGATINMYISEEVYDFDPAYAFKNDSALQIVNMIFSTLFTINEDGKVEKALAKDYVIDEDKNSMIITIRDDAYWSDGTRISANDAAYALKRVLYPEFTSEVACLLFDIKNARDVKNAKTELYIDDVGIYPIGEYELEITFEDGFTNYDQFIENLASPALAPLREDIIAANEGDWAKKPGTMACSGPFMIRKISYMGAERGITLERNPYYQRKNKDDAVDKHVTPYRIVIDYTKSLAEQYEMFKRGEIFYVGDFAIDVRSDIKNSVVLNDAMSTTAIYLNQNAYFCDEASYIKDLKASKKQVGTYVVDLEKESTKESFDEKTQIKTVTVTKAKYVTYYNHMSPEEYKALYPNTQYQHTSTGKKSIAKDYSEYMDRTYITTEAKVEDGVTVHYVTEYKEFRYTGPNSAKLKDNEKSYVVDTPYGIKLFDNQTVRQALSLVIDREALAKKVVYAKAATALVPYGVFNDSRKNSFREVGGSIISANPNLEEATRLIEEAGIDPSKYQIILSVQGNNLAHVAMAEEIQLAWESLGFKILLDKVNPAVNNEVGSTGEVSKDICDNIFEEAVYNQTFHASIVDIVAPTPRAYSILAPFANEFAGTGMDFEAKDADGNYLYNIEGHITGYNSEAYNAKIDEAFNAKDESKRAAILHDAEKILLEELPVLPLVFNQNAYVVSDEIVKVERSYFGTPIFTKTRFKDKERLS